MFVVRFFSHFIHRKCKGNLKIDEKQIISSKLLSFKCVSVINSLKELSTFDIEMTWLALNDVASHLRHFFEQKFTFTSWIIKAQNKFTSARSFEYICVGESVGSERGKIWNVNKLRMKINQVEYDYGEWVVTRNCLFMFPPTRCGLSVLNEMIMAPKQSRVYLPGSASQYKAHGENHRSA